MTKEIIEKELEICISKISLTNKINETSGRSHYRSSNYGVIDKRINAYQSVIPRFLEKRKDKLGISKFKIDVRYFTNNKEDLTIRANILMKNKEHIEFVLTPKQATRNLRLNKLLQ